MGGLLPENVYSCVRLGSELPEPRSRKFRNTAWTLIKALVTCRSKRILLEGCRVGMYGKSANELADEWSQDIEYGDETFNEAEETLAENEIGEEYESVDFESCSSDD